MSFVQPSQPSTYHLVLSKCPIPSHQDALYEANEGGRPVVYFGVLHAKLSQPSLEKPSGLRFSQSQSKAVRGEKERGDGGRKATTMTGRQTKPLQ
jgi:hypothetical protein